MPRLDATLQIGVNEQTQDGFEDLQHSVPSGYRRSNSPARLTLDPFLPIIDQILEDDNARIKNQRHTAKRIHAGLRAEHGFTGGIAASQTNSHAIKRRL